MNCNAFCVAFFAVLQNILVGNAVKAESVAVGRIVAVLTGEGNVLGACGQIVVLVAETLAQLIGDDVHLSGFVADREGLCLAVLQCDYAISCINHGQEDDRSEGVQNAELFIHLPE